MGKFPIETILEMLYKMSMDLPPELVTQFAWTMGTVALAALVLGVCGFLGHFLGGILEGWSA
jgi:hypothetical protein